MAREAPQHIVRWSPQDWRTSKVRMRSATTNDPMLRTVYRELIDALCEKGGVLPSDTTILADELLLSADEIARCLPILAELGRTGRGGIVLHDNGTLTQQRTTEDLATEREYRKEQARLAKEAWETRRNKGAKARRRQPNGKPEATHRVPNSTQCQPSPTPTPTPSPTPSPSPAPTPTPSDPDPERARAELPGQAIPDDQAEIAFRAFIACYPPEGIHSEHAAMHAWSEVLPWMPSLAELLDALKAHKRSEQWAVRKAIPSAEKWLRERRWTGKIGESGGRRDPFLGPDFGDRQGGNDFAARLARELLTGTGGDLRSLAEDFGCGWPLSPTDRERLTEIAATAGPAS